MNDELYKVYLDSGTRFGFWEVFWILKSVFGFWDVFWILGSVLGSGTCFWILVSVLDSGTCFVPTSHRRGVLTSLTSQILVGTSYMIPIVY